MFNTTESIVFLQRSNVLRTTILESITYARNLAAQAYGKSVLTADEGGNRNYKSATIFRYWDGYELPSNRKLFNEEWVLNCLKLVLNGVQEYESVYTLCTEQGKARKLNNHLTSRCKADAILLLHLLWVKGAILLPIKTPKPNHKGLIGGELYKRKDLTPELLGIFLDLDERYPLVSVVGTLAVKNTMWYAYRVIRASTWYSVSDIDPKDIAEATRFTSLHSGYSCTLRQWLLGLSLVYPKVPYDASKLPVGKMGTQVTRELNDRKIDLNTNHGLKAEYNIKVNQWIEYIHKFSEAKKTQGVKTWKDFKRYPSIIVSWLLNEIAPIDAKLIPSISEFQRKHLDGFDGIKGLLEHTRGDTAPNTYKANLYKIESFFNYLAMHDEFSFVNRINKDVDYPFVRRNNRTSKVIFDGEVFAPLLSFAYALADWAWYLYEKSKDGNLETLYHNNLAVIDTEQAGFVPLFWVNGKPHPIKFITPKLAPLAVRKFKGDLETSNAPDIHYLNLFVVLFETGIRGMSLRWLDVRNYRKCVNPSTYRIRDYGVTKLHVNTDKVGPSWESSVSNTVIEILDRQAEYRGSMDEPCLSIESWYDGHENSPFGKILPLFSTGGLSRGVNNQNLHTPISDASMRKAHKLFIYLFQAYYYGATGEQISNVAYKPSDKENCTVSTMLEFENLLNAYEPSLIEITPHSARSQVVSKYITLLPPSEIMKITGHTTEAHCIYYAQLDKMVLDKVKQKQVDEIMKEMPDPISVAAKDQNSALRKSFQKNRDAIVKDFGATSFVTNNHHLKSEAVNAVELIKTKKADEIAFNTTHICPSNNICPDAVLKQFETDQSNKPCGGCFYSVKTVDHIPAILAKIRALTDESNEIQQYIKEAKTHGADANALSSSTKRRRYLSDEIIAWSVTFQCLEQMASTLVNRDNWLVQKPDLLSHELTKMEIRNEEFQGLLIKAAEAKSYAEFFTPTLEHQIVKSRAKLLAYTGNFKALLDDTPDQYELTDQYRGMVQSICSTLGIDISDLATLLEQPLMLPETPTSLLTLLSNTKGDTNA